MYVKLFNQILDSSIADDRKLRHFFTDLLLCADPDGNVLMTKQAISQRIRAPMEEVEWGLSELMKPDKFSKHHNNDGRRIVPLDGHGYGWMIVNYAAYRNIKSASQMREETRLRVQKHRQSKSAQTPCEGSNPPKKRKKKDTYVSTPGEQRNIEIEKDWGKNWAADLHPETGMKSPAPKFNPDNAAKCDL